MSFVDFFIRRPIFASVLAVLIVLFGGVSIPTLPVAQYPQIEPPQVSVTSVYTGASSEIVETAVTIPVEQQVNGVEGMRYIVSSSSNDGISEVTTVFDLDRDVDIAAVDVQNRVNIASGRLPTEVKQVGVQVNKNSSTFVLAIGFYSDDDRYSSLFISNYADQYIRDALKRVPGVGNVQIFGERKYAMRVWLDPQKLAARQLSAQDVSAALLEQNIQVAAGAIGANPAPQGLAYQLSVRARGRLNTPAEFEDVVVKRSKDGGLVRVRDIARVELGAEDYGSILRFNRSETVGMGIFALSKANALTVEEGIKAELERLSLRFPPGLKYKFAFTSTDAVRESIKEVLTTLLEAIVLVIAVIFLFLQSWRSTLIPAITIPVSLIGTFAFVKAFGFSINTLTLFGLTLATGLVVDDAIVVIENIERYIQEKGLIAYEAAAAGMREVTGAVIATSLVLVSVFLPVAFFPGTTGRIYQQFSLTIAFSIAISAFNSLTLTPALSALLLKKSHGEKNRFFIAFDRGFDRARESYLHALGWMMRRRAWVLGAFLVLLSGTVFLYRFVPTGFVPEEDQGYFITIIVGPEGSSVQETEKVLRRTEDALKQNPEISDLFAIAGFSFGGSGPNRGIVFVNMTPWGARKRSASEVVEALRAPLGDIEGAQVIPFLPPTIQGVGNFGGFQFELEDRSASGIQALEQALKDFTAAASERKELTGVFSSFTANDPQLIVEVDRQKAKAIDLGVDEIYRTLQILLGSTYVSDFDFSDRNYRVYVQADADFRDNPKDIEAFYVRTRRGAMVPLGSVVSIKRGSSPQNVSHFNLFRSVEVNGSAASGYSTGQAIQAMQETAESALPQGFGFEWAGITKEQLESGDQSLWLFLLGLLVVFLVLAAQYESLSLPFVVLLAVPLALFGALLAQWLRGLSNDVFCQVGLVMLIGLASKNAILIVEFASQLREGGKSIVDAALDSARVRLRPILMTSLAFILGVLPLVLASGAGSGARRSLGTAVFGGMLFSTFLNLGITPVLFVLVETWRERGLKAYHASDERVAPADRPLSG